MPRNVRNFWLTAYVDGRDTLVKLGPPGKTGGMRFSVQFRDKGEVSEKELHVECWSDGATNKVVVFFEGERILNAEFER